MKKRILSMILAICMVLTLVPITVVANAAENVKYSDFFVCGVGDKGNAFNKGAGEDRKRENRMIEVEPNVYELTLFNVPSFDNANCYFTNGKDYYTGTKRVSNIDLEYNAKYYSSKPKQDKRLAFSSSFEWAEITYRLDIRIKNDVFISVAVTESHHHEFGTEWQSDASYHWQTCLIDGCSQLSNKEAHTYELKSKNGNYYSECSTCGVKRDFKYNGDDFVDDSKYTEACEAIDSEYTYTKHDLGVTYTTESTTFKVWAPTATKVEVNLYPTGSDKEPGSEKHGFSELQKLMDGEKWTGVWAVTVEGDQKNEYYTYTVTATKPTDANTTDTETEKITKETQDVYSYAAGVNGNRSMVCDLPSTNPEGWENDKHVFVQKVTDSLVWELDIKDFSYDSDSGVSGENQGKYLAFTETGTTLKSNGNVSTGIDYLKELGVTTVKLNPFYDFASVDESGSNSQHGSGNDPKNFNVPEGSYATKPDDGNVRIKECKQMIQALHNAGISVVMDVDYTHTFSKNSSFQATVPNYYYRLDKTGAFSNGSGYGNELATERAMYREFVIQSLLHWVNEYHIDGFNFNSMGLMDVETMNLIRDALDEVDSKITTWGDGYSVGNSSHPSKTCTGSNYLPATKANASKLSGIAFYNESLSTGITGYELNVEELGFAQGAKASAQLVKCGATSNFLYDGRWYSCSPTQNIAYASRRSGATLYDKLIASATVSCYGVRDADAVKMNKLAGSIVYMSQGIPFMLAGEEMCRSNNGDIGSEVINADSTKIKWQNIVDYGDVVSYYKGLMQIRKHFSPLTCTDGSFIDSYTLNGEISDASNQIAYTVKNDTPGEWSKMAVIFNSADTDTNVTLKDTSTTDWVVIANGESAGVTELAEVNGSTFTVPAYSTLIAVEKSSYESVEIDENIGRVIVNYTLENGKKIADSVVLQGTVGTYYKVPEIEIPDKYVLKKVNGNETGKFTKEDIVVNYIYESAPHDHEGGTANCQSPKICTICGEFYGDIDPDNHAKENVWETTETQHKKYWECCDVAEDEYENHTWSSGVCSVCGYVCKHSYDWQIENGQYLGICTLCGDVTDKKDIPTLTIDGADSVYRTEDYKFSFTLPEGVVSATYGFEFERKGDGGLEPKIEDGKMCAVIPASYYDANENSFKIFISATTDDGFTFSVSKVITILPVGDIDGDGEVKMLDVVMLQKAIAKLVELTPEQEAAADVNKDTKITMVDVVLIQRYIAKLITSFD